MDPSFFEAIAKNERRTFMNLVCENGEILQQRTAKTLHTPLHLASRFDKSTWSQKLSSCALTWLQLRIASWRLHSMKHVVKGMSRSYHCYWMPVLGQIVSLILTTRAHFTWLAVMGISMWSSSFWVSLGCRGWKKIVFSK